MKRLIFVSLIALILIACKMSSDDIDKLQTVGGETANVRIRNSAWEIVKEDYLTTGTNADIQSTGALESEIAAYNAAHTDDQWLLEVGPEISIEAAPEAMAYIVNSATLEIYYQATVARIDLSARRAIWRISVEAMADPDTGILVPCTLYIDNVPPEPPVIIPPQPRLLAALLDMTAKIAYYSQHFDTEAEAQHHYSLCSVQSDMYNALDADDGIDVPGHVWQAYIGETEYTFSTEE